MNEVSKIQNFAIDRFQKDKLVNTITLVETVDLAGENNIDKNKENVYPLVNIDLQFSDPTDDFVILKYEIFVLTQRDIRPVKTDSKLQLDTNLVDNLNETHSIANNFLSFLRRQNNPDVIELLESSDLEKVAKFGENKDLDGWKFTCELSIFNKGNAIL
jgi:hypothetical protein